MEPTIEKFLQGIPFAGMGTTLERNGLIGVVRELIKANKYTVDYILNYCESVGYQRKMTEEVFEELTGLSPKLIINNNEYYNAPIYVPACTIAWGLAKTKPNVAFYVVPGSYGYSVMEKNETDVPNEVIQTATIPEAIDELKKVAKNIQTLDKIITSKLLETEDIQSSANDIDQTAKPYFSDPIRELKKNFKNKVIDINKFEREAKKLVAEEKITVDEAEDLMNWQQNLVDEDDSYANAVLQHNEENKQLEGAKEIPFDKIYDEFLAISSQDEDTFCNKDKAEKIYTKNKRIFKNCDLLECAERLYQLLLGFNKQDILGHSKYVNYTEKHPSKKIKSWTSDEMDEYIDPNESLYNLLVNGNITEYKEQLNGLTKRELIEYIAWAEEMGIDKSKLSLHYITASKLKKNKAGYSNNSDYVGDWFGEGQIDYSEIINPEDDGKVWMVKLWGGSGYQLDVYLVKANEVEDAINKVFEWSYNNEGKNNIVFDYDYLFDDIQNSLDEENDDSVNDYIDEYYVCNEDYTLFARKENFFADELPEKYLGKKQSSVASKKIKSNNPGQDKSVEDLREEFVTFVEKNRPDDAIAAPIIYDYYMGLIKHDVLHNKLRKCYNNSEKESWEKFGELLSLVRYWSDNYNKLYAKKSASKKVISENVSIKDLEQKAKHYEELLKEEGYTDMKVSPNFAYGQYGFYFDWTRDDGKPGQKYTGLGTKKETWKNLELAYYELVNKIDWFMKRKSANINLNDSIKKWYTKTYKTDECGTDINPNTTFMEVLSDTENAYDLIGVTDSVVRERVFEELSKRTNIPYEKIYNMWMGKQASKKVTAENMTLEDMEDEDNKTEVEKEVEKIEETPIDELLEDNTPLDYFEKETQDDKVDTINDVVSKCIEEFSDKFKDFSKYDIKILSYKTKILGHYTPAQDEMIPDDEVNADAVLQVILAINNKADEKSIKKVLVIFSITDGKMHWTGTVRDENDKIVAFTEEGLDSIFNDEEPEEVEEII